MSNKQLVLTNEEYELNIALVENMIFFYEKDLDRYELLLKNKNFKEIDIINETKTITLTEEILLEEKEFLTTEIIRTKELLINLKK
jgi:hypothetical protein